MSNPMNDAMVAAMSRLGEAQDYKGQGYVCVAVSPHTRRDGSPTVLLGWESECAECGETFSFKTPNTGKFEPNRRCQAHRKPGLRPKTDTSDGAPRPEHATA